MVSELLHKSQPNANIIQCRYMGYWEYSKFLMYIVYWIIYPVINIWLFIINARCSIYFIFSMYLLYACEVIKHGLCCSIVTIPGNTCPSGPLCILPPPPPPRCVWATVVAWSVIRRSRAAGTPPAAYPVTSQSDFRLQWVRKWNQY